MGYVLFVLWVLLICLGTRLAEVTFAQMLGRLYYLFMTPGIIVHELSHALACLLTGAKIESITIFGPEGGSVIHQKPRLPVIGQIVISLAPLVGCGVCLYFCWRAFAPGRGIPPLPRSVGTGLAQIFMFVKAIVNLVKVSIVELTQADWGAGTTYLLLYLLLTLVLSIAPSKKDMRNASVGILLLGGILFAAEMVSRAVRERGLEEYILKPLWPCLSFVFAIGVIALLVAVAMWAICKAVSLLSGRFSSSKE